MKRIHFLIIVVAAIILFVIVLQSFKVANYPLAAGASLIGMLLGIAGIKLETK